METLHDAIAGRCDSGTALDDIRSVIEKGLCEFSGKSAGEPGPIPPERIPDGCPPCLARGRRRGRTRGLADECEVQLSYSIARSRPESVQVETFGSGRISEEKLASLLENHFDFRLAAIIREFELIGLPAKNGGEFYQKLAVYGQVGRVDLDLPWEKTDKTENLR